MLVAEPPPPCSAYVACVLHWLWTLGPIATTTTTTTIATTTTTTTTTTTCCVPINHHYHSHVKLHYACVAQHAFVRSYTKCTNTMTLIRARDSTDNISQFACARRVCVSCVGPLASLSRCIENMYMNSPKQWHSFWYMALADLLCAEERWRSGRFCGWVMFMNVSLCERSLRRINLWFESTFAHKRSYYTKCNKISPFIYIVYVVYTRILVICTYIMLYVLGVYRVTKHDKNLYGQWSASVSPQCCVA